MLRQGWNNQWATIVDKWKVERAGAGGGHLGSNVKGRGERGRFCRCFVALKSFK